MSVKRKSQGFNESHVLAGPVQWLLVCRIALFHGGRRNTPKAVTLGSSHTQYMRKNDAAALSFNDVMVCDDGGLGYDPESTSQEPTNPKQLGE